MTIPYVVSQEVWKLKAADETVELDSEFEKCAVVVIEITTANFSGTIDFQGKVHEVTAFTNVPWVRQDQATAQTPSVSQITPSNNTDVIQYVIVGWWRRLRIVMTRSGGTITCGVAGTSHGKVIPRIVVA